MDGNKKFVKIFGREYEVKAQVCRLEGSSGHADQKEMLDWARKTHEQGNVKKVALVHCEVDSAEEFQAKLESEKIGEVIIPDRGDTVLMS